MPGWRKRARKFVSSNSSTNSPQQSPQAPSNAAAQSLFKDMAACPFRAFAKHRLAARPLEETVPGLSYKDRGITVHRALQIIWTRIRVAAAFDRTDAGTTRSAYFKRCAEARSTTFPTRSAAGSSSGVSKNCCRTGSRSKSRAAHSPCTGSKPSARFPSVACR